MFCIGCNSGCREDLDDNGYCPSCGKPDIETILDSYTNGQRHQMAVQINEYGIDFWRDLRDHLTMLEYPLSRQLDLYQGITISYNAHFPHINQSRR